MLRIVVKPRRRGLWAKSGAMAFAAVALIAAQAAAVPVSGTEGHAGR